MGKSNNKQTGNAGENRACDYLVQNGYRIIERNWRKRFGEIDIIALKDNVLVFVEVKTWPKGDFFTLESALGATKQQRIIKTAKCFIDGHRQYNENYVRFDVLALDMSGQNEIMHIENAFSENI